jgi:magnesium transporter
MISYYYKNIRSKSLEQLDKYKPGAWVYVEDPSREELKQLIEDHDLDPGHIRDVLDEDEMPRLEKENDINYLFTRFAYAGDHLNITTTPLLIIMSEHLFISIAARPIPRIERFRDEKIKFNTTQRTKLLLQILDQIVDQYEVFLNSISRQIKTIRARLKVEEIRNKDFVDFVEIEDELNEFLSALTPTNSILRRLLLGKHINLFEEDEDIVEDLLLNNEQTIEGCRASLKSVVNIREAYTTIMSNNLNRIIRVLTVLTAIISVSTLVSSIYGMNVDLPYDHSPQAFFGIMAFTLSITVGLLIYFRKQKWL